MTLFSDRGGITSQSVVVFFGGFHLIFTKKVNSMLANCFQYPPPPPLTSIMSLPVNINIQDRKEAKWVNMKIRVGYDEKVNVIDMEYKTRGVRRRKIRKEVVVCFQDFMGKNIFQFYLNIWRG